MPFRKVFFNFLPQLLQASNYSLSLEHGTSYCRLSKLISLLLETQIHM